MQHKPLVFLDIETTGISHRNARVLEIGALRIEGDKIVQKFNQLLHHDTPIPLFITRLTGIDNRMIKDAPTFDDIADELADMLEGAIFVAHNVGFDYSFIQMEFQRLGRKFAMDRLCTVRLSRVLYPQYHRHNLDAIIQAHGLDVDNRHRAYDDAKVLFDFYQKAIREHGLAAYSAMNRVMTHARI